MSNFSITRSGLRFEFEAPKASMIDPGDLAHALSLICRFSGHVKEFYSVAQHSVLCSYRVPVEDALPALLHDAPEAYVCDLPRYLKRSPGMQGYRKYEAKAWAAIAEYFNLEEELPASIQGVDLRMVVTEWRDLMERPPEECLPGMKVIPYPETITPWQPWRAKAEFRARLATLWK